MKEILLAGPRGFCAGVDRAVDIVSRALELYGPPVYVKHEIVHNRHVVESLRTRGAVFVEEIREIPEGAVVVYSAHGVSRAVRQATGTRGLIPIDATCPLVTKVHLEAQRFHREGYHILLVGHAGHPEVEGTMGQVPEGIQLIEKREDVANVQVPESDRVAFLTQTTLSVDDTAGILDAIRARFPSAVGPRKDDICYATQNRQQAVKAIARDAEVLLVIGAPNSSNSNRLREVAEQAGCRAYLIEAASEVDPSWLAGVSRVGVTAGASAPESLVQELIVELGKRGVTQVREVRVVREHVSFPPPEFPTRGTPSSR